MNYLYEEDSRKIIGAVFKVYNTLGYGYKEVDYQRALAKELTLLGYKFSRELYSNLRYEGDVIVGFYVDFMVEGKEGKIVVELKVAEQIYQKHFYQILAYLKNYNVALGLLFAFNSKKVLVKRIVNQINIKENNSQKTDKNKSASSA